MGTKRVRAISDAIPASLIERPLITEQVLAQSRPVRFSDWMQDWMDQPSVPRPVPVEVPAFPENPRDFPAHRARWGAANLANLEAEREYYREVRRRRHAEAESSPSVDRREVPTRCIGDRRTTPAHLIAD